MIIKQADDRRQDLTTLQNLLEDSIGHIGNSKKRIKKEICNIKAGIKCEGDAAYLMKIYYGDDPNWMVIHDLRIECAGLIAQIDHLLINRQLEMWICESKHYSEGIAINERGEFTSFYRNKPLGGASPIEQNNTHTVVLRRLLDSGALKMPKWLGFTIKPTLKSLVLISKEARISRPNSKIAGIETVIKADMLFKAINQSSRKINLFQTIKAVSHKTLESFARELVGQHKPIMFNWRGKFGLKQPEGLGDVKNPNSKHLCHDCKKAISQNIANFCLQKKSRYDGNIFCINCQKNRLGIRNEPIC